MAEHFVSPLKEATDVGGLVQHVIKLIVKLANNTGSLVFIGFKKRNIVFRC